MGFKPVPLNAPAGTSGAKRGLLSVVTLGLQGGTRFASNWLIASFAGKVVFGTVAVATSLAFLLHTFWPSSTQSAASKFVARARGKEDDVEVHAVARQLSLRVVQVTAFLAVVSVIAWVVLFQGQWWEGLCVAAILVTVCTSQYARGIHFGADQVARGTRVDIIASVVGIAATGVLLALGVRNMLLTLPLSLSLGVYSLLCWPWTAHGRPERALRSEIDKFVTFSAIGSVASAGMLQMSQLVTKQFGEATSGIYGVALQLVTPMSLITTALIMVFYPGLAKAHGAGDHETLRRHTDMATRGFVAVLVAFFGGVAIAARPVIHVVYSAVSGRHDYAPAAILIPVFCLALLVNNVATPSVSAITAGEHKYMWYPMLASQGGLLCAVIVWFTVVPHIGVFAVAAGYAFGAIVCACFLYAVAWRLTGQKWVDVSVQMVVACVLIAVASWAVQRFSPNLWIDIAVAVVFGLGWLAWSTPVMLRLIRQNRS
ncbi:lipopolysaccharide biosynthesis protein [Arachnia propionica]|uniref:Lipopolysaccharide biosynthesis protein n=1 Tax=Arachnia propionica TaxID=1750 RepID=A0A3P1WRW2_9ACTN|nr:lipopolysaccharide biosynthesis protein [Arachnia propionica]